MDPFQNSHVSLGVVGVGILLTLVFLYLYRHGGKKCFAMWTGCWLLVSIRGVFLTIFDVQSDSYEVIQLMRWMSWLIATWGISDLIGRRIQYWWLLPVGVCWLWLCFAPFDVAIRHLPGSWFIGIIVISTAVIALRTRDYVQSGGVLMGSTMLLLGLYCFVEPAFYKYEEFNEIHYVIVSILIFGLIVSMLHISFDLIRTAALRSEERYRLLAENARDVIFKWMAWPSPRVEYVSPSVERLLGYKPEEFYSGDIEEITLLHPDDVKTCGFELNENNLSQLITVRLIHRDGQTVPTEQHLVPVKDHNGKIVGIQGICRDISERAQAEQEQNVLRQQLLHSQKMEALGLLAGGVAHDINNVLSAIMGVASLLERRFEGSAAKQLSTILSACNRGRELTRNLLGFARKGMTIRESILINDVVSNVGRLLESTFPKHITLEKKLSSEAVAVEGDAGQLEQVVMNLCLNAVDAMADVGKVTIVTGPKRLTKADLSGQADVEPGRFAMLQVIDDGAGMDSKTIERVFEPFYTTKPHGKGTGLGLSMVYGTVCAHGGVVDLKSAPGKGTTVSIFLPALINIPSARPVSDIETITNYLGETVLLVDDEEIIRETVGEMLGEMGFKVLKANDGKAACKLFEKHTNEISLIILDLAMPGMDGRDTLAFIREQSPDIPIVLTTGYSRESYDNISMAEATGFLQKPFDIDELSSQIVKMLGMP